MRRAPAQTIDEFISDLRLRNCASTTIRSYRSDLREFFEGQKTIHVEYPYVRRYLERLASRTLRPSTVNHKMHAVRSFYRWASSEGLADENPTAAVERMRHRRSLPEVPSVDELNAFIDRVGSSSLYPTKWRNSRSVVIFELLYGSGLRVAELAGLDLSRIDREHRLLLIRGKGKVERVVPFGRKTNDALTDWYALRSELLNRLRVETNALLVAGTGERLTTRAVGRIVGRYSPLLPGWSLHPHLFRTAFASHMLDRGAPLRVIQEMLGHVSIHTTQFYLATTTSRLMDVHSRTHPAA